MKCRAETLKLNTANFSSGMEIQVVFMCARHNTSKSFIQPFFFFDFDIACSYGWDWGPVLMTIGPWRPVRLHSYVSRITDLRVRTEVSETLDVTILASVETDIPEGEIKITIKDPKGDLVRTETSPLKNGKLLAKFNGTKGEFDLWYPIGYGKQPLYTVEVQLSNGVSTM